MVLRASRSIVAMVGALALGLAGCAVPGPLQAPLMDSHLVTLHCRAQAQPAGASAPPPKAECFTTPEEALVGLALVGTQQQVARDVANLIPHARPYTFAGAGKPYCAAALQDARTMTVRAACFATDQERAAAIAAW
jgi:hypothetical protein